MSVIKILNNLQIVYLSNCHYYFDSEMHIFDCLLIKITNLLVCFCPFCIDLLSNIKSLHKKSLFLIYYHCASVKLVNDRAVHGFQAILGANLPTLNWRFLLVDAKNVFNEINMIIMFCTVRHSWPSGALFLKYYCH